MLSLALYTQGSRNYIFLLASDFYTFELIVAYRLFLKPNINSNLTEPSCQVTHSGNCGLMVRSPRCASDSHRFCTFCSELASFLDRWRWLRITFGRYPHIVRIVYTELKWFIFARIYVKHRTSLCYYC